MNLFRMIHTVRFKMMAFFYFCILWSSEICFKHVLSNNNNNVHIIISNSKVIITCLSTFYNVTIGIKQQCLFSLFMYFNNYETIIIQKNKKL